MQAVAEKITAFYDLPFGGKESGRFRLSMKLLRQLVGRKRLYPEDIQELSRALYERGFILIDMETFFVVLNTRSFASYRRLNDSSLNVSVEKPM